jgi:hypothetical protein
VKKVELNEDGTEKKEQRKEYKGKHQREERTKYEHDENSYYYKYYYGQRPVIEKNVTVTIETVVPETVAKD